MRKYIAPVGLVLTLLFTTYSSAYAQSHRQTSDKNTSACPNLPGDYVILQNQTYALCAGAQSVNFGQITYAKCKIMVNGTSISKAETYPYPSSGNFPNQSTMGGTSSGNISTVNQSGGNPSYIVSTYSHPSGTKIYTCQGGSYAQCDGGLCFRNTTGTSNNPLWGTVNSNEIICSCPVATGTTPYQVFGPASCPATAAEYDAVCGANVSNANNGAVIYIGAIINGPDLLDACLATYAGGGTFSPLPKCDRPAR